MCATGVLDSNFNEAVIDKISNFHEIAPNFTYSQKSQFLKYNCKETDPINFMAGTSCKESTFSFLPACSLLTNVFLIVDPIPGKYALVTLLHLLTFHSYHEHACSRKEWREGEKEGGSHEHACSRKEWREGERGRAEWMEG